MDYRAKEQIRDIAKRMHRIMRTFPAIKGIVPITGDQFASLNDKDFTILWYMPITLIADKDVLKDMERRAESLGLMQIRKTDDKIHAN